MRRSVAPGLCALALAFAAPALAQGDPAGLYVAQIREAASGLDLRADGRFNWMFTAGALDLTAEGRWRRDGNDVLLDTEPPVEAPRFEYLGAGNESAPALVVRIEDARGRTPEYLDVEGEYDAGEPGYAQLDGDAYRFAPSPGRRIVAIRVGSAIFGFWSERYPVPAAANPMHFRFFQGGLGRADFRGARGAIDGDTLTLTVLGSPVRYRREGAAAAAPAEAPAGPAPPVAVTIGETVDAFLAHAPAELRPDPGDGPILGTARPVMLSFRLGGRVFDFGRVGGSDALVARDRHQPPPAPGRWVRASAIRTGC